MLFTRVKAIFNVFELIAQVFNKASLPVISPHRLTLGSRSQVFRAGLSAVRDLVFDAKSSFDSTNITTLAIYNEPTRTDSAAAAIAAVLSYEATLFFATPTSSADYPIDTLSIDTISVCDSGLDLDELVEPVSSVSDEACETPSIDSSIDTPMDSDDDAIDPGIPQSCSASSLGLYLLDVVAHSRSFALHVWNLLPRVVYVMRELVKENYLLLIYNGLVCPLLLHLSHLSHDHSVSGVLDDAKYLQETRRVSLAPRCCARSTINV